MAIRLAAHATSFVVEPPQALFEASGLAASGMGFDVADDGRRFLFFAPLAGQATSDEIHVRLNGSDARPDPAGEGW